MKLFFSWVQNSASKMKKKKNVSSFAFNLNLTSDFIDLVNKNWLPSDITGNGVDTVDRIVCHLNCIEPLQILVCLKDR